MNANLTILAARANRAFLAAKTNPTLANRIAYAKVCGQIKAAGGRPQPRFFAAR